MTLNRHVLLRLTAIGVWMVSMGCLGRAIQYGAEAEMFMRAAQVDRTIVGVPVVSAVADRWAVLGWLLHFAAAAMLAAGIEVNRIARKIFIALGILIAADGSVLLFMALMVR